MMGQRFTEPTIVLALRAIRPGAIFTLRGDTLDGLEWHDENDQPAPTQKEIDAAIAVLPPAPIYLGSSVMLARLTPAEYAGLIKASLSNLTTKNDGQLSRWLDMVRTQPQGIDLNDPVTQAAKAALVSAGILSQDRADAIFAAQ